MCPGRAHMARFGYLPVVLVFDLVRLSARSRGSVEERPLHTRKVAGSIPAGTTHVFSAQGPFLAQLIPFRAIRVSRKAYFP